MDSERDQVLKAIWHYQERLGRYASSGSDEKLLYTLEKLKKLPIKTAHLENTGVGRTVNGLKKLGGDVGEAAKSLVALWKEMVLQEEQKEEEEEQSNDVDSSYSSESECNKLKIDEPPPKIAAPTIKEVRENSVSEEHHKKDSHRSGKGNDRSSNKEEKGHSSKEKEKHKNGKDHRVSKKEEKSSQHSKANGEKRNEHRENEHSSHSKSSKNSDRHRRETSHKSSASSKERDKHSKHKSSKYDKVDQNHKKRDSSASSESEYESETGSNTAKKKRESTSESESDKESSKYSKRSDRGHSSDRESHTKQKRHDSSSSSDEDEYDKKEKQTSRSRQKSEKVKTSEDEKHSKKKRHHSESSEDKETEKKAKSSDQVSSKFKEKSTRKRDESDDRKHSKKKRRHSSESSDDEDRMKKEEKHKNRESSKSKEKSSRKREDSDDNRHSKKKRAHSSDGSDEERVEKKSKSLECRDLKSKDKSSKSSKEVEDKHRHKDKKTEYDKDRKREKSKDDSKSRNERGSSSSKSHSSTSSKDKDANKHKDEKKNNTSSKSKSKSEQKTDKDTSRMKVPKAPDMKKIADGIDSGSGASFAEALGLCGPPVGVKTSSSSKKRTPEKSGKAKEHGDPPKLKRTLENSDDTEPPMDRDFDETDDEENVPVLLKQPQLEPLNISMSSLLPEITPNYRPLGIPLDSQQKRVERMTDDEALSRVMNNKNYRTKVYSGNKMFGKVDTLFDLCVRILQDNIDALEYTGGVPYSILKPVLDKATPDQLFNMEHHNPYLIEETDELWQLHCQKEFRTKKREELESWREMYMRCLDEREARLNAITANIKQAQDKSIPVRTTKLAYVDSVVKPPRNIARKQAKNGIIPDKRMVTPADRLAQLAKSGEAAKVAVPNPGARAAERSSSSSHAAALKPKKAPLMAKTLSFMKNRFKR